MTASLSSDLIKDFVIAAHFDLDRVRTLLAEHPDLLNVRHQWGPEDFEDGIGAAAHVGSRAIAEFFLAQGAPSSICVAAMLGRADEVRQFLEADPALANARGAHGIALMFHAAMSGSLEVVDLLYERGCREGFSSALHGAINHGHKEIVAWLLDHGAADMSIKNFQGKSPMQNALDQNRQDIADLLRQRGANQD